MNPFWELVWGQAQRLLGGEPEQKDIAVLVEQSESAVSNWRKGLPPTRMDTILEVAAHLHLDHQTVWDAAVKTAGAVITDDPPKAKARTKLSDLPVRRDISPI